MNRSLFQFSKWSSSDERSLRNTQNKRDIKVYCDRTLDFLVCTYEYFSFRNQASQSNKFISNR